MVQCMVGLLPLTSISKIVDAILTVSQGDTNDWVEIKIWSHFTLCEYNDRDRVLPILLLLLLRNERYYLHVISPKTIGL